MEDKSRKYATQGFLRRAKVLVHCIEGVFEKLPPDTNCIPSDNERLDATVYFQAFVFNVFGCLDNLAHIWVSEKGVQDNGKPLADGKIGLGKKYKGVRNSLSTRIRDYLIELDPWFVYLEGFRHALAHRIPPYIPPYSVPPDREIEYKEIEARINEATISGNVDLVDQLKSKKMALVYFSPVATHSFEENAPRVCFHAQMLADFDTVEKIARMLFNEFD